MEFVLINEVSYCVKYYLVQASLIQLKKLSETQLKYKETISQCYILIYYDKLYRPPEY